MQSILKTQKNKTKKWARKAKENNNNNKKQPKNTYKTKQSKKKKKEKKESVRKKKGSPPTQPNFSEWLFTCSLPVPSSKSLEHNPFRVMNLCYLRDVSFFVKSALFFELFEAISFSVLWTFWISAVRLFIFMNFSSLDL